MRKLFKNSVTIFLARVQMVVGAAGAVLLAVATDPSVTGPLQAVLQPRFIPFYIIGIGVLTELARRRTLGKQSDAQQTGG